MEAVLVLQLLVGFQGWERIDLVRSDHVLSRHGYGLGAESHTIVRVVEMVLLPDLRGPEGSRRAREWTMRRKECLGGST